MKPGPDTAEQKRMMAMFKGVDPAEVARQVSIDKDSLLLRGYESSGGEAVIRNSMPGEITLRLEAPPIKGLDVQLDKTTLKNGEEARLTVHYDPPTKDPKPASEIVVHIDPTGQVFRVKLTFDIQPELKKLLPKELQK
jgi:hypothetical protein